MTNPYASYLGGLDPVVVMGSTAGRLNELAGRMTAAQIAAPRAEGKWSPREIFAHMADCELAFSFRLRQMLAAPAGADVLLQPFDQTAWGERYAAYDAASALGLFTAARGWNVKLLGTVTEEDMARTATHPERGEMTFRNLLELIGGHDINHLQQMEALVGS